MISRSITLSEMLQQQDYEVFSRTLHALSHQWMARMLHLKLLCRLTMRLIAEEMPLLFIPPDQQSRVIPCMEHWNEIHESMRTHPDKLRCMLWIGACVEGFYEPGDAASDRTDYMNRQRWYPYDESAWDTFFVRIVRLLTPTLYCYDAACAEMQSMLAFVPGANENEPSRLRDFLIENYPSTAEYRDLLYQELNPDYVKSVAWY